MQSKLAARPRHALPGFLTGPQHRAVAARVATRSRVQPQLAQQQLAHQQQQRQEPNPHSSLKRDLVVAVDHTEGSYKALKWTLQHLYRDGDVLHLLHVVPASVVMMPQFGLAPLLPPAEGEAEHMAAAARQFFAPHRQLAEAFGAVCQLDVVHGSCNQAVSKTICRKVEELAASVVVLSEAKPGLLPMLFQTPVSKQVAETCSRPTLIFHSD